MPRSAGARRLWSATTLVVALASCRTYEPHPLSNDDVVAVVAARRQGPLADPGAAAAPVSLAQAMALARESAPELRVARGAASTAALLADLGTPLPNPTLSLGPLLASGADVTSSARWGYEVAVGWLLDLSGGRKAATGVLHAEARAAAVEAATAERATYLALRRAFTQLTAATKRREAHEEIAAAARASQQLARQLVEAAKATALDVVGLDVEAFRAAADVILAREDEDAARDRLAELTGTAAATFVAVEPALAPHVAPPQRAELVDAALAGHPELDVLRAEHAVAEARIRTQLAAQFPGLELGAGVADEDSVETTSLSLGFELPLFDRNERGIEAALGARRDVASRFEAEVERRIAAIDAVLGRLARRRERLAVLSGEAEPAARRGLNLAELSLRGGLLDATRYLDVARTERSVRLDRIVAEQALLEAWSDLEAAVGSPFLQFASTAVIAAVPVGVHEVDPELDSAEEAR